MKFQVLIFLITILSLNFKAWPDSTGGGKLCVKVADLSRLYNESIEEAYRAGRGCYAENTRKSIETLNQEWADFYSRFNQTNRSGNMELDLDEIQRMNIEAAGIWEALVSFSGDAERARENYFSWSKRIPQEIKSQISTFHQDMENLLFSTRIEESEIRLKGIHPFFFQVLMEFVAQYPISSKLFGKGGVDNQKKAQTFASSIYNFMIYYYNPKGYQHINFDNQKENIEKNDWTYRYYKAFFNAGLLMRMISHTDCSDWGLSPEINYAIMQTYIVAYQSESPFKGMVETMKKTCPMTNYIGYAYAVEKKQINLTMIQENQLHTQDEYDMKILEWVAYNTIYIKNRNSLFRLLRGNGARR